MSEQTVSFNSVLFDCRFYCAILAAFISVNIINWSSKLLNPTFSLLYTIFSVIFGVYSLLPHTRALDPVKTSTTFKPIYAPVNGPLSSTALQLFLYFSITILNLFSLIFSSAKGTLPVYIALLQCVFGFMVFVAFIHQVVSYLNDTTIDSRGDHHSEEYVSMLSDSRFLAGLILTIANIVYAIGYNGYCETVFIPSCFGIVSSALVLLSAIFKSSRCAVVSSQTAIPHFVRSRKANLIITMILGMCILTEIISTFALFHFMFVEFHASLPPDLRAISMVDLFRSIGFIFLLISVQFHCGDNNHVSKQNNTDSYSNFQDIEGSNGKQSVGYVYQRS